MIAESTTAESDHTRLILLEGKVGELQDTMEMQVQATRDLVDAWEAARTFLSFIQLAGRVATAIGKIAAVCVAGWLVIKGIGGAAK